MPQPRLITPAPGHTAAHTPRPHHIEGRRVSSAQQRTLRTSLLLACALALPLAACRESAPAFGSNTDDARQGADQLFTALGDRFNTVYRQPRYNVARIKLAHYALAPSKIYDDTSVWVVRQGADRFILANAGRQDPHYVIHAEPKVVFPEKPGDARHIIRLRKLVDDEYLWTTDVDFGIGRITAPQFADVLAGLYRATGSHSEALLRANYRAAFPRSSAAFGKMFSIDTLHAEPRADGSALVTFVARIDSDRLKPGYPYFAAILEKYIRPATYHLTFTDRRGARWMEMEAKNFLLSFRFRARDGHLVPMDGAARPMPDELIMTGQVFAKVRIFTVGVTDLVADVTWLHDDHQRGFVFRFNRPPEWHLPPAAGLFLRGALARPFEKGGGSFRIAVIDSLGPQTTITRHLDGVVKEGTIIRWLGGLSGTAMGDYVGPSEVDENRFVSEGFYALRADLRELLAGPGMPVTKDGSR